LVIRLLFELVVDEGGEGVGGDAAGAADGDGGELAGADEVVDGGAADLQAGHDLGDGEEFGVGGHPVTSTEVAAVSGPVE
jgi:hypothetical protein